MADDLVVNMLMDIQQFLHEKDRAKSAADELEDHLRHVATSIAGAFGIGFGIDKAVEGIKSGLESGFEAVKGQIEDIVALQHQSEKLGLGVNDLRALRLEAKHAGDDFESVAKAVFKFQVNLAEAVAAPEGKKGKVFGDLGLDATSMFKGDILDAIGRTGDRISALNEQGSKSHAMFELFGRAGFEAMNTILRGSEGLEEVKSRMQMVTPEQIREMEEAHDRMLQLDESVAGLARAFAIELAPAIGEASKALADFLHESAGGVKGSFGLGKALAGTAAELGAHIAGGDYLGLLNAPGMLRANLAREGAEFARAQFESHTERRQKSEGLSPEEAEREQAEEEERQERIAASMAFAREQREQFLDKTFPEHRFAGEIVDLFDMFNNDSRMSTDELSEGLAQAAERFEKEMEAHDPFKKMKDEIKHLVDEARTPEEKFEDTLNKLADAKAKVNEELKNGFSEDEIKKAFGFNSGELNEATDKAFEELARAHGLGSLFDDKNHFHHIERMQGPEAITDQGKAYDQFFKNLQPNVDEEARRQTELQKQLVEIQKRAQETLESINRNHNFGKLPPVVSMGP